ncbi:unnamed protein product [Phytophthora lilii]|uniref:Unnamed protein product n=1 Tax=Phytophthora lilii TaxID=2077276 RepID=A0A9W6U367_9STRA|nr:unnamed protein product [Phytophthora lilii]
MQSDEPGELETSVRQIVKNKILSNKVRVLAMYCLMSIEELTIMLAYVACSFDYDFSKALQSTDHLGIPNPLRTAVCFDVLTKISNKFPRFQKLTVVTQAELERSTYMNELLQTSNKKKNSLALEKAGGFAPDALKESLARRAYFTELKEVLAEKWSLEQRL